MSRSVPPLRLRDQFGFLARFAPVLGLILAAVLLQIWKGIRTDELRSRLFHEQRRVASLEGIRQQEHARYLTLTAFARLEPAAARLGLEWPEQPCRRIVVADGRMERMEAEDATVLPAREETACAR